MLFLAVVWSHTSLYKDERQTDSFQNLCRALFPAQCTFLLLFFYIWASTGSLHTSEHTSMHKSTTLKLLQRQRQTKPRHNFRLNGGVEMFNSCAQIPKSTKTEDSHSVAQCILHSPPCAVAFQITSRSQAGTLHIPAFTLICSHSSSCTTWTDPWRCLFAWSHVLLLLTEALVSWRGHSGSSTVLQFADWRPLPAHWRRVLPRDSVPLPKLLKFLP